MKTIAPYHHTLNIRSAFVDELKEALEAVEKVSLVQDASLALFEEPHLHILLENRLR